MPERSSGLVGVGVVVHSRPNALSTAGKRTFAVLRPPLFARLQPMEFGTGGRHQFLPDAPIER